VTFAAHYPVGYPAIVGAWYWAFGPEPWLAMLFNALLGSLALLPTYWIAAEFKARRGACLGAGLAAFHPSLILYTPALMTEAVTAACLAVAGWLALRLAARPSVARLILLGVCFGITTLVRPQMLLLAPAFAALGVWKHRAALRGYWGRVVGVSAVCLLVCAPWTLRNCVHMNRCVLVSANAGWNLLIGTAEQGRGAWISLDEIGVPASCRTVFEEAEKDSCFGRAALASIGQKPFAWLALAPEKLRATFDYPAAPAHYLHMSNAEEFPAAHRDRLGLLETAWQRGMVALCLFAVGWKLGPRRPWRASLAAAGTLSLLTLSAVPAVLAFLCLSATLRVGRHLPLPVALAGLGVGATALMHAVFFGAGRYSLVVSYLLAAVAGAILARGHGKSPQVGS
jgi:4-amino-4-deoxy-L-arabinose transferase-like glycosyltransferase